jgi:hypothetical protein
MARGRMVENAANMTGQGTLEFDNWEPIELILEGWAQGLLVGSLVILSFITLANMRRGVLLHKVSINTYVYTLRS